MRHALVSLATIALIATSSQAAFLVFSTDDNHTVSFAPGVTPGNNNVMQDMFGFETGRPFASLTSHINSRGEAAGVNLLRIDGSVQWHPAKEVFLWFSWTSSWGNTYWW